MIGRKVWIETTSTKGRLKNNEFSIGRSLFCPLEGRNSQENFTYLSKMEKGDIVIHLLDKKIISSVSFVEKNNVVEKYFEEKDIDKGWHYYTKLTNNKKLKHPLIMDDVLNMHHEPLLKKLITISDVFYSKSLNYRPNIYLTFCSKEFLTLLNNIYAEKSGELLPHVNHNMIHEGPDDELLSYIEKNKKVLQLQYQSYGSKKGEFYEKHNAAVFTLEKSFKRYLDFDFVESLVPFPDHGDIDLVLGHEKSLILIEYKSGKRKHSEFIDNFVGKQGKHREHMLFNHAKTKDKEYDKVVHLYIAFLIHPKELNKWERKKLDNGTISHEHQEIKVAGRRTINILGTHIMHRHSIEEYFDLGRSIDRSYAHREFLKYFNIVPEKTEYLNIPATKTFLDKNKKKVIYSFACSAKELAKFATVSRRGIGKESISAYQRLLKGNRIKDIGENFIDAGNKFANNIIIKLNDEKIEFDSFKNAINEDEIIGINKFDIGLLKISNDYHSSFVIDGQHRLFSYLKSKQTDIDDTIQVSGLSGIDERDEASFFIDINDKAKGVDANLIWDLAGALDPESENGIISNACKELVSINKEGEYNHFHNNIKIPSLNKSGISFGGLCRTLRDDCHLNQQTIDRNEDANTEKIRNPFYSTNHKTFTKNLTSGIYDFFLEINKKLNRKRIQDLYTDGVIAILCMLAKEYYSFHKTKLILESDLRENGFFECFGEILSSTKISELRRQTTSQQKNDQLKAFIMELKSSYDSKFGSNIPPKLIAGVKALWEEKIPKMVYLVIKRECDVNFVTEVFKSNPEKIKNWERTLLRTRQINDIEQLYKELDTMRDIYYKVIANESLIINGKKVWKLIFSPIFLEGKHALKDKKDLTVDFERLSEYKAKTVSHSNPHQIKYKTLIIDKIEASYNLINKIVDDTLEEFDQS